MKFRISEEPEIVATLVTIAVVVPFIWALVVAVESSNEQHWADTAEICTALIEEYHR